MYENKYEYINILVAKSKNGDEKALFELFEFYMPLIISSVNRCITKDSRLSNYKEDIISDSIFVFSKLVDKYDPTLTYFSYYISTRIDINLFRFINGRYFSEQEVELSEQCENIDPFNKINNTIVLHSALEKLSNEDRDIIDLYFFKQYDQKECAMRLNISQGAFSKKLSKALNLLKIELGQEFMFD